MHFSQSRLFVRHAEAALLGRRIPVGVLDLDVFGPSVPILQGLQHTNTLPLTSADAVFLIRNHANRRYPWAISSPTRGQQLLFDVDWRNDGEGPGLDVLVANMLPGTRDVQLTLGQLVVANGTCADPRCWMLPARYIHVEVSVSVRDAHVAAVPTAFKDHGSSPAFRSITASLDILVLGELPLVKGVSVGGHNGAPYVLTSSKEQAGENSAGGAG
ncbi:hypothetical protein SCLCIDRAFT_29484 [Scleroderma citrinum Foug A]|uniref:Uncharacterized protein n=1 Tax=Scleroderma citrinum Foug A TaxID=1036808 RepID=A0A0C2ZVM9_9AGAM|nr:hypothetical protein SCLCIDRAFT_29484 [Scleroderma citrinum Foug A]